MRTIEYGMLEKDSLRLRKLFSRSSISINQVIIHTYIFIGTDSSITGLFDFLLSSMTHVLYITVRPLIFTENVCTMAKNSAKMEVNLKGLILRALVKLCCFPELP